MPEKLSKKELIDQIRKTGESEAGPFVSSPSELIKDYYGGEGPLREELASAKYYSEKKMQNRDRRGEEKRADYFKEKDIEGRMFEEIPVYVDPQYGASYTPSEKKVKSGGSRVAGIDLHNASFYLEKMGKEGITQIEADRLQRHIDNLKLNEFEDFGDPVEMEGGKLPKDTTLESFEERHIGSGLEHEMGHHVYRPEKTQYPVSTDLKRSYFDNKSELFQALGKFQREHFKKTGERVTKPEELYNLIKSGEDFDYLSKEGSRLINYLKKEGRGKKGDEVLKFISELAPMFVKNNDSSFADSVENRLS